MSYTKPCPECGERLNVKARACECGWTEAKGKGRSRIGPCFASDCPKYADGDDGLCGYHRALKRGDVDNWRRSGMDWREPLFADFRLRHESDSWGAAISASYTVRTEDDKRELLEFLKLQAVSKPLPYDPNDREAA